MTVPFTSTSSWACHPTKRELFLSYLLQNNWASGPDPLQRSCTFYVSSGMQSGQRAPPKEIILKTSNLVYLIKKPWGWKVFLPWKNLSCTNLKTYMRKIGVKAIVPLLVTRSHFGSFFQILNKSQVCPWKLTFFQHILALCHVAKIWPHLIFWERKISKSCVPT